MNATEWSYVVFGIVIVIALIFDLGLFSKKSRTVSIKQALLQTVFWVALGLGFFLFVWLEDGHIKGLEYISAYLMEWALSVDNIFVFILIFTYFKVDDKYSNRILLFGILIAIILRVLFITVGIVVVQNFEWVLYLFGAFIVYTGIKMLLIGEGNEFDPEENVVYKLLKKVFPLTKEQSEGNFTKIINGKKHYTMLFVVMILLAAIDLVFAFDSLPAVFAITQSKMIIYTSNIFAVLGLRSLFFLIRGAVDKFRYLKEGIAVVLIFIGAKMLITYFDIHLHIWVSLAVIVGCLSFAILFSILKKEKPVDNNAEIF
ncbi:MAG: TerC/Alx family metal homeostasis membrane protein [Bacteroidota bacterium]|nr:TerC/Alx family metal homeostasis membrane protein [Bacteroidota bacterium]